MLEAKMMILYILVKKRYELLEMFKVLGVQSRQKVTEAKMTQRKIERHKHFQFNFYEKYRSATVLLVYS